ncbi:heme ABC exporter ATP-binding protein CcmA [Silvibacterium sp.]|uniref:heme ABC exporter ATP-binding protein CcmA n=1 Tax=Silvibacterium sp. TaxID=1964179 RepID=UPI0039E29053
MSCAVELKEVSKVYGSFAALRKVSLRFEPGCCYVLLGENGAGKSTLLRMVAGLLRPTYGAVRIERGAASQPPVEVRQSIGYMSHAPMLYEELTALENLQYFASLYRGQPCLTPEGAMRAVGLDPVLARPVGQYSQGMRQRASLARVLLSRPELLLLDEPFSNMDAASAQQMLALVAGLRAEGKTIILTTHQRELAEPIADYLLTLQAGRVESLMDGPARGAANQRERELQI